MFKFSPKKRSKLVGSHLAQSGNDVIVLQELFYRKAYKNIKKKLKKTYPYSSGKAKNNGKIVNSGLVVFSKFPIENVETFFFGNCALITADCFSAKGAIKVSVKIGERIVSVYNTHLQAESSLRAKKTRVKQLKELAKWVEGDSQEKIIAGDFNIDKHSSENSDFHQMIDLLDVYDHDLEGDQKYTTVPCENTLKKCNNKEKPQQLDYIFLKDIPERVRSYEVVRRKGKFKKGIFRKNRQNDLSDHYGVELEIEL